MTMAIANAMKDNSSRGLLIDGLQAWEGLVTREVERLADVEGSPLHEALLRSLDTVRHLRQSLKDLTSTHADMLRSSMHKTPLIGARAVTRTATRPLVPSSALPTSRPRMEQAHAHGHTRHSHGTSKGHLR